MLHIQRDQRPLKDLNVLNNNIFVFIIVSNKGEVQITVDEFILRIKLRKISSQTLALLLQFYNIK